MNNSTMFPSRPLESSVKISIVLAGYGLAFLFACGLSWMYVTFRPDWVTQGSQGMAAFGDSLHFFGVLGLGGIPPTALGLWFLRKNMVFWNLAALAILAFAATAPLAEAIRTFIQVENIYQKGFWMWADLACLLRTLAIPILAVGYGVCLLVAPTPKTRWAFVIAIALEAVTGLYILSLIEFSHRWC